MKFSDLITKKVHIIGINGIGMSALAIYLKKNNIDVSGSDIAKNSNTQVIVVKNELELKNYFEKNLISDEIIIGMGAGLISKWLAGLKNTL